MKQATAIGASLDDDHDQPHRHVEQAFERALAASALLGVSVSSRPMPKNKAKNITDRIELLEPIASIRLLGMMLMKASIPDGCSALGLNDHAGAARRLLEQCHRGLRSTPAPGLKQVHCDEADSNRD